MAYDIRKEGVWVAEMSDDPGQLARKLKALDEAGANLEFIIARRAWNKPGAVVFVAPLHGTRQVKAARAAGFERALGMHSMRMEGPDRKGLAAEVAQRLGGAGVNIRGYSAAALGRHCAIYFAFARSSEAAAALRILKKQYGNSARRR